MTEKQIELFMEDLANEYSKTHKKHMSVIRRYTEGFLSFDDYKQLDNEYTTKLDTLRLLSNMLLRRKNSK